MGLEDIPPGTLLHRDVREALCERLRDMYSKGWVSGTGGGICTRIGDELLLAPTGVHKERVKPYDLFSKNLKTGELSKPINAGIKPSECTPIFEAIIESCGAGAVAHSHGEYSVLAADLSASDFLIIKNLEMLKGVEGCNNQEPHQVPIISNTAREINLTGAVRNALEDPRFNKSYCILVRDHGAYIWGSDLDQVKKHLEVYDSLFRTTWKRASMK